jgi:hypothetical protein
MLSACQTTALPMFVLNNPLEDVVLHPTNVKAISTAIPSTAPVTAMPLTTNPAVNFKPTGHLFPVSVVSRA